MPQRRGASARGVGAHRAPDLDRRGHIPAPAQRLDQGDRGDLAIHRGLNQRSPRRQRRRLRGDDLGIAELAGPVAVQDLLLDLVGGVGGLPEQIGLLGLRARVAELVLDALEGGQDQLSNARAQAEQAQLLKQASDAADQIEQQILNRYRAGQLSYTEVVTAQASALSARRALVQTAVNRQVTAITLIQALGGGWDAAAPVEIKSSVRADNPR